MNNYFKIARTSETGQKIEALEKRVKQIRDSIYESIEKYKIQQVYRNGSYAAGAIEAVIFKDGVEPDLSVWKREKSIGYNAYSPRRVNEEGKKIAKEFDSFPKLERSEFDKILGFPDFTKRPGIFFNNSDYILIIVESEWNTKLSSDCEEITGSEYKKLCGGD